MTYAYVAKRIGQALVVILVAYTAVFVFVHLIPSDVLQSTFNGETMLPQATIDELAHYYGLDRPVWVQYFTQLGALLGGNFGFSINTGQSVGVRIGSVIGSTLQLASLAVLFAFVNSILLLYIWVSSESRRVKQFVRGIPEFFASVPVFVVGIVGIQIFSFGLGWVSLFSDGSLQAALFPALVLSFPVSAPLSQVLLQGAANAEGQPYVQTARAKGLTPLLVCRDHVLKNIAGPYLTVFGLNIGALFAGSVITETVFGRSGLGSILLDALVTQDVQLIQGLVLLTSVTVVVINLLIDFAYVLLDPRVRLQRRSRRREQRTADITAAVRAGMTT